MALSPKVVRAEMPCLSIAKIILAVVSPIALSLAMGVSAHAQVPDGVQDTDFPVGYWAVDYFEGINGMGPHGPSSVVTWHGESFAGVGGAGPSSLASNGSAANNRWSNTETPTDPLLPPGYVGSTWSDINPSYEVVFRRTAQCDGTLRVGYNADAVFDDNFEVKVNSTREYAYWPGGGAPNPRILGTNFSPSNNGIEVPLTAGDEIEMVFQNLGFIGGYTMDFWEVPVDPTITKTITSNVDEDRSGTVTVGDTLTYTAIATNNSTCILEDFTVSDPLITPDTKSCGLMNPGETCTLEGDYVVLPSNLSNGTIENTATISSPEFPEDFTADLSSPVSDAPADFSITKTNTPGVNGELDQADDTLTSGQTTTFTLVATNNGPSTVTGAVVTDTPTTGLTCTGTDAVTLSGDGVPAGSFTIADLTGGGIALDTLTDGQSSTLTYSCEVN